MSRLESKRPIFYTVQTDFNKAADFLVSSGFVDSPSVTTMTTFIASALIVFKSSETTLSKAKWVIVPPLFSRSILRISR